MTAAALRRTLATIDLAAFSADIRLQVEQLLLEWAGCETPPERDRVLRALAYLTGDASFFAGLHDPD